MAEEIIEHGGRRWKRLDDGTLRIWDEQGWRQPTSVEKAVAPPAPIEPPPPAPPPAVPINSTPSPDPVMETLEKIDRSSWGWIAKFAAVLVVIGLSWLGIQMLTDSDHELTGSLAAPECGGGYDIGGAAVEIRNEDDSLIAATTTSIESTDADHCTVTWTTTVPDAEFYQVTIGSHGGPSYSRDEMESMGWSLVLSLD